MGYCKSQGGDVVFTDNSEIGPMLIDKVSYRTIEMKLRMYPWYRSPGADDELMCRLQPMSPSPQTRIGVTVPHRKIDLRMLSQCVEQGQKMGRHITGKVIELQSSCHGY